MLRVILSHRNRVVVLAAASAAVALLAPAQRAAAQTVGTATISVSTHAPTGAAISQPLFDAPTGVSYGVNDSDYIGYEDYSNNPSAAFTDPNTGVTIGGPGQSFTPTSNLTLNSITVKGDGSSAAASAFAGTNWTLTLGTVSTIATGSTITVLDELNADATNVLAAGNAGYITFNLGTPLSLSANTVYVYAIRSTAGYFGFAKDNGAADGDVYTGGASFLGDANTTATPNVLQTDDVHNNPVVDPVNNPGGATDRTFFINGIPGSSPITFSQTNANWTHNGSGNWETGTNWSSNPSVPGAVGSQITFGSLSGSPTASHPIVNLGQAANATLLDFQSPDGNATSGYTINNSAVGSINVSAQIEADSGVHTINTPVTFGGAVSIYVQPGASLTIPSVSNSGQYGDFYLTANDGVSTGGTFSEGGMSYCSLDIAGTWNFLASQTGSAYFFAINLEAGSLMNVGSYTINNSGLYGTGTTNIGAGGKLTLGLYNGCNYTGSFTGSGSLVFTSLSTSPNSNFLYVDSPAFNGPITVNGGNTLATESNNGLGSGAATNTLTLDNGIFQAIGSFTGSQNVIITANGGTIDTDGHPGGDATQPVIAGGCAITLGSITSTAAGTLTKINAGQVTASKITGISLVINGGTVRLAPNGTAAGASSLNALTFAVNGTNVPQGQLNITNNAVTILAPSASDPITTITGYLATGRDNGLWDGAGIESTTVATQPGTSIGYADGNTDTGTSAAAGTIVVMDTWLGDLNLDGAVNSSDVSTLVANLGHSGSGVDWAHGDLNYDGVVNDDDFSLFMLGAADYKAGGSIPVPEPTAAGLMALAAGALARRRRR